MCTIVIVAFIQRLGLLPLVGPQDMIHMAHAITAAKYLPTHLTDDDVSTIENIGFTIQVRRLKQMAEGKGIMIQVANRRNNDVFMAWQTPDHSEERVRSGMHVAPIVIPAGTTSSITSFHRHNFYLWDALEGDTAPLYRQRAEQRWVRRVTANVFTHGNTFDLVIDDSFQVVVVNMCPGDRELLVGNGTRHVIQGGGSSLSLIMFDGQKIEVAAADFDATASESNTIFTVHRSGGDPQLLPIVPKKGTEFTVKKL